MQPHGETHAWNYVAQSAKPALTVLINDRFGPLTDLYFLRWNLNTILT